MEGPPARALACRCPCSSDDVITNTNDTKGITKSLLTEAFFQKIIGSSGTVVSWQPFEVGPFIPYNRLSGFQLRVVKSKPNLITPASRHLQ